MGQPLRMHIRAMVALPCLMFAWGCDVSDVPTYGEDKNAPAAIFTGPIADGPVVEAPPPSHPPGATTEIEATFQPLTVQRIDQLVAIAAALEAYRRDNGSYPNSGGAFASYKMSWGNSKGQNWIPELVPRYMPEVPREPTKSENPDGPQYLYASDGSYFKIIVHYPDDCETATKSERVLRDPARTRPDGTCWAYGIWSANGQQY